jgi:release factor glutamine methyltransferase
MTAASFRGLLAASGLPRLEALALMQAASGRSREWLIGHELDRPDEATSALFQRWARLRQAGEPIAYLVGWREFYGRRFWVNRNTLIPRMETEMLVDVALKRLQAMAASTQPSTQKSSTPAPLQVCDLGTGSGSIAISLALEMKESIHITATDQSQHALQVARNNAAWLEAAHCIEFAAGSWWQALTQASQRFHGIVSNPPYIPGLDGHLGQGDLRFEPMAALRGEGDDGLGDIQTIAAGAIERLEPKGFLLIEHGYDQQDDVTDLFVHAGFADICGLADLAGRPRAVLGVRP